MLPVPLSSRCADAPSFDVDAADVSSFSSPLRHVHRAAINFFTIRYATLLFAYFAGLRFHHFDAAA